MDIRAETAKRIDDLGDKADQLCPAMREGWLAYNTEGGCLRGSRAWRGRELVVEDEDH